MDKRLQIGIIVVICSIVALLVTLTFNDKNEPKDVYRVYLDGKAIGVINSKEELENYINDEQQELKDLYNVENVYKPLGLEINRYITYQKEIDNVEDIYEQIKEIKPFTIMGYIFTIDDGETSQDINVLDKDMFESSLNTTIRAFVDEDEYEAYLTDTQVEIKTVGKNIESVSIKEKITVKEDYISTNELIFTEEGLLSMYLMFGSIEEQDKYVVEETDNLSDIALKNNLSPEEFLIANPEFTSINNLLYIGQKVNVGLIKPQVQIEVIEHVVEDKEDSFKTEIIYDSDMLVGNSYVKVEGENGLVRATSKVEIVNGKIESAVPVSNEVLSAAVNKIVIQGGRVVPSIGDNTYWAWPTITPYVISSGYGPRWGVLHDGTDISGCGYGSPIYAGNNGTVYKSEYSAVNGHYVVINHNNGYYSMYAHLSEKYVVVGQVISRGEVIGAMGASGYATGTHLHYGIFIGAPYMSGSYSIDPMTLY